jgi:SAM-dependent methyltransferase
VPFRPLIHVLVTALVAAAALGSAVSVRAADEVPFVTTPDQVTLAMLQLARVGPKDVVLDLGSGDGRIVITAARRFGARGLGVEIDPALVARSRDHARQAGVAARAEFREQDLFKTDLSQASVITMYLLPEVNLQLRPALLALRPGTRIVSHDWDMGDWPPERTVTLDVPDKKVGLEKKSRVHLWTVPARVAGLWCSAAGELRLRQTYSAVRGSWQPRSGAAARLSRVPARFSGRLAGAALDADAGASDRLALQWRTGDRLRVRAAAGSYAALRRVAFVRAAGESCP